MIYGGYPTVITEIDCSEKNSSIKGINRFIY